MSLVRGSGRSHSTSSTDGRTRFVHVEERRSIRSTLLGTGTLACGRCDAPIAIGADRLRVDDLLSCPFCLHRGPVREFLSLAVPTRPARVAVRVVVPAR